MRSFGRSFSVFLSLAEEIPIQSAMATTMIVAFLTAAASFVQGFPQAFPTPVYNCIQQLYRRKKKRPAGDGRRSEFLLNMAGRSGDKEGNGLLPFHRRTGDPARSCCRPVVRIH